MLIRIRWHADEHLDIILLRNLFDEHARRHAGSVFRQDNDMGDIIGHYTGLSGSLDIQKVILAYRLRWMGSRPRAAGNQQRKA